MFLDRRAQSKAIPIKNGYQFVFSAGRGRWGEKRG